MTPGNMADSDNKGEVILKDDDFADLEQRYMMHIIMMIHRYPGCLKSDIADLTDSAHNTKYSRVQYLVEKGYAIYMNVNGNPTRKLQLTEKGKRVAECVETMYDILKDYE